MSERSQKRSMAVMLLIAGVVGAWYVGSAPIDPLVDPQPKPAVVDLASVPEFSHPLVLQLAIHRDHAKAYGNLWASMAKAVETGAATPQDLEQFSVWHDKSIDAAAEKMNVTAIGVGPLFDVAVRGVLGIASDGSGTHSVYMADRSDDVLRQLVQVAEVAFNGK